ncbi:TraR/DksA family transcriptional regulator [bacterium]|nr:MAG: TraR/DksA family transcriptional regulator [bacterium]
MTPEERSEIKKKIISDIEETKRSIADLEQLTKPIAPDDAIGRLTRMEAINSRSINEASLNQARAKLNKLERALERVDKEDFGICVVCEQPIPVKRMLLMPEAIKCVRCAE